MNISKTLRPKPQQISKPNQNVQLAEEESAEEPKDGFDGSRIAKSAIYGAVGGLTASLPGVGLLSNSASLVANIKSDNGDAAFASGLATFLSIGSLVIPEGDAGLLPYIMPGVVGGIAWAAYGYNQGS